MCVSCVRVECTVVLVLVRHFLQWTSWLGFLFYLVWIIMEHVGNNNSLECELKIKSICSIRNLNQTRVNLEKSWKIRVRSRFDQRYMSQLVGRRQYHRRRSTRRGCCWRPCCHSTRYAYHSAAHWIRNELLITLKKGFRVILHTTMISPTIFRLLILDLVYCLR